MKSKAAVEGNRNFGPLYRKWMKEAAAASLLANRCDYSIELKTQYQSAAKVYYECAKELNFAFQNTQAF